MEGRIRVLTAFGNQLLLEHMIQKLPNVEFVPEDLQYQDALIEVIKDSRNDAEAIILNTSLEGSRNPRELIQFIKSIRKTLKIVPLFKSAPDEDMQEWLVSRGIHYVLVDNSFTVEDVYQALLPPEKLRILESAKAVYLNDSRAASKGKPDIHSTANRIESTEGVQENTTGNDRFSSAHVHKSGIIKRLFMPFVQTKPDIREPPSITRMKKTITIALFGSHHGSGCTHTAISMAWFLTNQIQERVAVVEMNESPVFKRLAARMRLSDEKHFEFNGFDLFYDTSVSSLISMKKYGFILIDCGCICKRDESGNASITNTDTRNTVCFGRLSELERADLKICLCQIKPWQMDEAVFLLDPIADDNLIRGSIYCLTMADERSFQDIKRKFKYRSIFKAFYDPEIFYGNAERDAVFREMLAGILPVRL